MRRSTSRGMLVSIIRTRAPLRLGLAGGGTDLSPFSDEYGGAVLNVTIDRYAYAFIAETPEDNRVVFRARDLGLEEKHEAGTLIDTNDGLRLHRAIYNRFLSLGRLQPTRGFILTTTVDAPPGSGLGSSSALVVAMCEAFRFYVDAPLGLYDLAHLAFEIERVDLRLAGGKQDHYAAAFGGINFIEFLEGDRVVVNPLRVPERVANELEISLVTCFTGVSRESSNIIEDQTRSMKAHDAKAMAALTAMKEAAFEMKDALLVGDLRRMGSILEDSWKMKKLTSASISTAVIDRLFEVGLNAGAYAGKVSGAGGGGFIFFLVQPEERTSLLRKLRAAGADSSPVHLTNKGVETWIATRHS